MCVVEIIIYLLVSCVNYYLEPRIQRKKNFENYVYSKSYVHLDQLLQIRKCL